MVGWLGTCCCVCWSVGPSVHLSFDYPCLSVRLIGWSFAFLVADKRLYGSFCLFVRPSVETIGPLICEIESDSVNKAGYTAIQSRMVGQEQ